MSLIEFVEKVVLIRARLVRVGLFLARLGGWIEPEQPTHNCPPCERVHVLAEGDSPEPFFEDARVLVAWADEVHAGANGLIDGLGKTAAVLKRLKDRYPSVRSVRLTGAIQMAVEDWKGLRGGTTRVVAPGVFTDSPTASAALAGSPQRYRMDLEWQRDGSDCGTYDVLPVADDDGEWVKAKELS